ncbi:MAG TPA: ferritin-like domain-containing protein [Candidatus Acidoferrales bacterium]|jgi:hypothetical protein|nr:ferritin-like domain-containing protein [Candidatus Acidoferrales bacterium]
MPHGSAARRNSQYWIQHFQRNRKSRSFPWFDPYRLCASERLIVGPSLQQFQLGEGAQGRGLLRRAKAYARHAGDLEFPAAMQMFIAEEQQHSVELGRFLTQEGIPLLATHWVDTSFRGLRKLAGLEVCACVLVSAELIALPYYHAVHHATQSPLLRALCRRILHDEAYHLEFQAATIARLRVRRTKTLRMVSSAIHNLFFVGTQIVVWFEHRRLFMRGGYTFRKYFAECQRHFHHFNRRMEHALLELSVPAPAAIPEGSAVV